MSVFSGPEEHAANPPEAWQVVKVGQRNWQVRTADGETVLWSATTKKECGYAIEVGFIRNLYDKETRWYAGEHVDNWKPYASRPCHERNSNVCVAEGCYGDACREVSLSTR